MKTTFEFLLPEDQREYDIMNQAFKMQSMLCEFSEQLRSWYKYHHDFTSADDALNKIRDEFYKQLNNHEVNIDL